MEDGDATIHVFLCLFSASKRLVSALREALNPMHVRFGFSLLVFNQHVVPQPQTCLYPKPIFVPLQTIALIPDMLFNFDRFLPSYRHLPICSLSFRRM